MLDGEIRCLVGRFHHYQDPPEVSRMNVPFQILLLTPMAEKQNHIRIFFICVDPEAGAARYGTRRTYDSSEIIDDLIPNFWRGNHLQHEIKHDNPSSGCAVPDIALGHCI